MFNFVITADFIFYDYIYSRIFRKKQGQCNFGR